MYHKHTAVYQMSIDRFAPETNQFSIQKFSMSLPMHHSNHNLARTVLLSLLAIPVPECVPTIHYTR